jgi:uncharacterized protein (TIGR03089 family)
VVDAWSLLQSRVRSSGAAPFVTYVDAETGERTELSAVSVANAAAKIANAIRGEFDCEPGETVDLDLPLHWQWTSWCLGTWVAGCVVRPERPTASDASVTVTTVARAHACDPRSSRVVVASLHPFGLPVTDPLPAQVEDATIIVRQQPDAYLFDPGSGNDSALAVGDTHWTQDEVLDRARKLAEAVGVSRGGRLLVPADRADLEGWLACAALPLAADCSIVIVHGSADDDDAGAEAVEAIAQQEQVTARLTRASGS